MTAETIIKVPARVKIVKRGPVYEALLSKELNDFKDLLLHRSVIVRLLLNGYELAVRGRVTLDNDYTPRRLRVLFPRRLTPTLEKLHGMELPAVIEFRENNEVNA